MNKEIISQRFNELIEKSRIVEMTIKDEGYGQFNIDQEKFMTWGISCLSLLEQVFSEKSIYYLQFKNHFDAFNGWLAKYFISCKSVFYAAYEDYTGGYIFSLRGIVAADIIDDGLSQAEELLNSNYKDPACVIAGVCLETSIKELCDRNSIPHSKLDKMNADLKKAGIYNTGMQKQITAWADRRNDAAHGNWNEYTKNDVKMMIEGVRSFIGTYI